MREFLRHFFLPRHTNNHRARALHPSTMLCYVLFFALVNLVFRFAHQEFPSVLGYATDIRIEQLLLMTNQKRQELGLQTLTLNEKLNVAAAKKANDMFTNDYWSHNSPQGKTPWDFINSSNYRYTMAGENLAKNFSTSKGVVDAWMASPTHKDNIVKPGYRDIGFAIVNGHLNGEETTLVVQMFGTSQEEVASMVQQAIVPSVQKETVTLGEAVSREQESGAPVTPSSKTISSFSAVLSHPFFNIPTLTRDLVFVFLGILMGVFILDGIIVKKRKIVRITGHTLAHIIFLTALCVILLLVKRGALI